MKKQIIQIGTIVKTHGIKGNLIAYFYSNDIERLRKYKTFFSKAGKEINLSIESAQNIKNKVNDISTDHLRCIVRIDKIIDCQQAQFFVGSGIFINKEEIEQNNDEFLISDLIGMEIYKWEGESSKNNQKIGMIESVHDFGGGPLIAIKAKIKEYIPFKMLSFTNELFPKIDLEKKIAYLNFNPEDVVELNENETSEISDEDVDLTMENWGKFKKIL